MSAHWLSVIPNGFRISVQISPNAKETQVIEISDDFLRIRLKAPPVEGKANEALIRFVAETLNIPRTHVTLTHGHTSKRKRLEVHAPAVLEEKLRAAFQVKADK